jgi:cell volume regulation protein A
VRPAHRGVVQTCRIDPIRFGQILTVGALVALAALVLERPARRLGLPAPLAFLAIGAVLGLVWSPATAATRGSALTVLGSIALIVILLDGGLATGIAAIRRELAGVLAFGVVGTVATFALVAVAAHVALDCDWSEALIVGAVLSPTDPAAVFSVLGDNRERLGRVVHLLEGEAGFNDPIAIALTAALVAGATGGGIDAPTVVGRMVLQGAVGIVVGVLVGIAATRLLEPRPPTLRLTPTLTVLAGGFLAFGAAATAHGSGFVAVYLFGLLIGDRAELPERELVLSFHDHLAGLAEIGMFALLGIALADIGVGRGVAGGLVLAAFLVVIVRPLIAVAGARPARLSGSETRFVGIAGLKGAVPILLAALPLAAGVVDARRILAIASVAVIVSLAVQGLLVARAAARNPAGGG